MRNVDSLVFRLEALEKRLTLLIEARNRWEEEVKKLVAACEAAEKALDARAPHQT